MRKVDSYFHNVVASVPFKWVICALIAIEILSFAAFQYPLLQLIAFILLVIAVGVASLYKLEYGIYAVLTELVIGSKGYLFFVAIGSFTLSIRLALFLVVFAATIVWIIRERHIRLFQYPLWKWTAALIGVLVVGVVTALINGNPIANIFLDANGYLFLGLVLPITQAIRSRAQVLRIFAVLFAASIVTALKTILLLVLFSQTLGFDPTLAALYKWVRDTGVGEITASVDGFPRIFFQSHVYMMVLFFIAGIQLFFQKRSWPAMLLSGLAILILFLGGSRSMWVATGATACVLIGYLLATRRSSITNVLRVGAVVFAIAVVDFVIAYGLINIPVGTGGQVAGTAILTQRTSDDNATAAVASRRLLLPALIDKSAVHPILGSGFGTTVTYQSEDPRAKEAYPEGYTTYSFEWGYLDILVKFGAIGLLVFIGYYIATYIGFRATLQHPEQIGLFASITAIFATHFFTPYLNHPLGIGWILLATTILFIPTTTIAGNNHYE